MKTDLKGGVRARGAAAGVLGPAFAASVPVLLGYSTIGIAFGLLVVKAGLPWFLAPLMSVIIYAGAAQFMAIGLLAAGSDLVQVAILTLVINARHMVYGLSLLDRFAACRRWKAYLIYALTDETYGLLTTVRPPEGAKSEHFYAAISALDQSYWVIGSALGAIVGGLVPTELTRGLDFALTALFVVLLVEQIRSIRRVEPYAVAAAATVLAFLAFGPANLLVIAILLAIAGILIFRRRLA